MLRNTKKLQNFKKSLKNSKNFKESHENSQIFGEPKKCPNLRINPQHWQPNMPTPALKT